MSIRCLRYRAKGSPICSTSRPGCGNLEAFMKFCGKRESKWRF
jgi:hypothetical protein